MLAVVAADAGEAALEVAAVEEFVDHLGDDAAEEAIAGLVLLRINLLELGIVAVSALPERGLFGISGAIELHGPAVSGGAGRPGPAYMWTCEQYWMCVQYRERKPYSPTVH